MKSFDHDTIESLAAHLAAFVPADNVAEHLEVARSRTPFQAVCDGWARDPAPFKTNPHHLIPGPYKPQY